MAKRDEHHTEQEGAESTRQAGQQAAENAREASRQAGQAAEGGRESAERMSQQGREGIQRTSQQVREGTEKAGEMGREMAQTGRMAAERGTEQMMRLGRAQTEQMRSALTGSAEVYRDLASYSREDVEALMQSGAVLARGAQEIGWEVMQLTQHSLRRSFEAANELMGCRSVEDMLSVQRDLMRENVEKLMDSGARMLEMSSRLATEAVQPVRERVGDKKRHGEEEGEEVEKGRATRGTGSGEPHAVQAGRSEARA